MSGLTIPFFFLVPVFFLLQVSPAVAQSSPSALTKSRLSAAAETYASAQYDESRNLLEAAARDIYHRAPLRLGKFLLVQAPANGFGVYQPRTSNVYSLSEKLQFYFEPQGAVLLEERGMYSGGVVVDIRVIDGRKELLFQKENFQALNYNSRSYVNDIYINLSLGLEALTPGNYRIEFRVRDKNSKKIAYAQQDVVLR